MISSVFGYQVDCAENLGKAYNAYKTGDVNALSELSGTFAKETGKGILKLAVSTVGQDFIESLTAETKTEGLLTLFSVTPIKIATVATTAINGIATVATAAVSVVPLWIEKTRRQSDILRQLGSCKDPEQQKVLCEELGKLMTA